MMIWASESNLVKAPDSTKAKPLIVEGVTEKPSSLNLKSPVLVVKGLSKDVRESPESSKVVVPRIPSKPVIVLKGAPTTPIIIKPVTQLPVVDAKAVPWNYKQVIVTYKGKEIEEEVNETGGLTRSGRCFTPEELRKSKPFKDSPMPVKESVTDEEAEEFLKKMKVQDYSIVEKPWIHAATAVPSSMHQMVKFEWDRREIVVHGDEDLSAWYCASSVPQWESWYIWFGIHAHREGRERVKNLKQKPSLKNQSNSEITIQEVEYDDEIEYDEEAAFDEISKELKQFEEKPKPNLSETEAIHLGDQDDVRETKISVHLEPKVKEEIIKILFEYKDVFAWSYDDMSGLSTDLLTAKVIRVTRYPTWLANIMPVPIGKTRVCVDYRDLNKARPKEDFPLPNIHILIDNCAKHKIGSFADCYTGYHQFLMDEEDAEKTAFITLWGKYYYRFWIILLVVYWVNMTSRERRRKQFITSCKKFTPYEVKYTLLERTCCALIWVAQKLKHYLSSYTIYLISRMDPPKYIFQKPMPTGRLAKWYILLTEFNIIYVTRTTMKAQALSDHLAENPVDDDYEPLKTYFPDEEVMCVDEVDHDEKPGWKLFFDGAANMKGVRIGVVLIFETRQHYPVTAQLRFYCTNNMAEYEACILGLRLAIDMGVQEILVLGDSDLFVHQIQGE
ncbi:uncharacterized protein [Nicotiana sylvestris]|uniref:uncharacterized protein n=1 Tax=Nicotiana sylvestris TaxID=4096 RepID=UPI00388C8438